MGVIEVLGVERRRRWPDAVKLSILAEVNTDGWSPADVARRHDVTRQHIYQWRRKLRAKGLLPGRYMCQDYEAPGRDDYRWETTVGDQRWSVCTSMTA